MLKLKQGVTGITIPILNANNQEIARIALDENTSQEDLKKVYALDACKRYFTEDSSVDAINETVAEVIPPVGEVEEQVTTDEQGALKKKNGK